MNRAPPSAAAIILGLTPKDIPLEVLHMARRCVVDTIAVWGAGTATVPSKTVRDHAARRYLAQCRCRLTDPANAPSPADLMAMLQGAHTVSQGAPSREKQPDTQGRKQLATHTAMQILEDVFSQIREAAMASS